MSSSNSNRQTATNANNAVNSGSQSAPRSSASANANANANTNTNTNTNTNASASTAGANSNVASSPFQNSLLSSFGSLLGLASLANSSQNSAANNANSLPTPSALLSPSAYAQMMLDPMLLALATASLQNRQQPTSSSTPFPAVSPTSNTSNPFAAIMSHPFNMMLPPFLSNASSVSAIQQHTLPSATPNTTAPSGLEFIKLLAEHTRLLNSLQTQLQTNNKGQSTAASSASHTSASSPTNANPFLSLAAAASPNNSSSATPLASSQLQSAMAALTNAIQTLSSQNQNHSQSQNQNQTQSQNQNQPAKSNTVSRSNSHTATNTTTSTTTPTPTTSVRQTPNNDSQSTPAERQKESKHTASNAVTSPRSAFTPCKATPKNENPSQNANTNSALNQKRVTDFSIHTLVNSATESTPKPPTASSTSTSTLPSTSSSVQQKTKTDGNACQPPKAHARADSSNSRPNNQPRKNITAKSGNKQASVPSTSTSASTSKSTSNAATALPATINVPEAYLKPFELGWRRETRLKPAANNTVFGEVAYLPPATTTTPSSPTSTAPTAPAVSPSAGGAVKRITTQRELLRFLQQAKETRLKKHHFCFNPKSIFGAYLIWHAESKNYREMTHNDLQKLCEMVDAGKQNSANANSNANANSHSKNSAKKLVTASSSSPRKSGNSTGRAAPSSNRTATAKSATPTTTTTPAAETPANDTNTADANATTPAFAKPNSAAKRRSKPKRSAVKDTPNDANAPAATDSTALPEATANHCDSPTENAAKSTTAASANATKGTSAGATTTAASRRTNRTPTAQANAAQAAWTREVKRAFDDLQLTDSKELPEQERIVGNRLGGTIFAECLALVEFLHTFGNALGFDKNSLPTMNIFQRAFCDADDGCKQYVAHLACALLNVAMKDPVLAHVKQFPTKSGDRLGDIEVKDDTLPKILRVFMACILSRDAQLNAKMKKAKKFSELDAEAQCKCMTFVSDELLGGRFVSNEIDRIVEQQIRLRKEKWAIDTKLRRARLVMNQKFGASISRSTTPANAPSTHTTSDETNEQRKPELDLSGDAKPDAGATPTPDAIGDLCGKQDGDLSVKQDGDGVKQDDDCDKQTEKLVNELCMIDATDDRRSRLRRTAARSAKLAEENAAVALVTSEKKLETATSDGVPVAPPPPPPVTKESEESESELGSNFLLTLSAGEDEFANLTKEELQRRITKLEAKEREKQNQGIYLQRSLRGLHLGNDRFYRNYWVLSASGGVMVESFESADFDPDEYVRKLDLSALAASCSSSSDESDSESADRSTRPDEQKHTHSMQNGVGSPVDENAKCDKIKPVCVENGDTAQPAPVKTEHDCDANSAKPAQTEPECEEKPNDAHDTGKAETSAAPGSGDVKVDAQDGLPTLNGSASAKQQRRLAVHLRIPEAQRSGWWRIADPNEVHALCRNLNTHGVREKILHRNLTRYADNVSRGADILRSTSVFAYDSTHLPAKPRIRAIKPRSNKKNGNSNGCSGSGNGQNTSRKGAKEHSPATNAANGTSPATNDKASDARKNGEERQKGRSEPERSKAKNASRRGSQLENGKKQQQQDSPKRAGGLDDVLMSITNHQTDNESSAQENDDDKHSNSQSESESGSSSDSGSESDSETGTRRSRSSNRSSQHEREREKKKNRADASRSRSPLLGTRANVRTVSLTVQVLREIEELEERVFGASLQSKGWSLPCKMAAHERIKRVRRDFKQAVAQGNSTKQAQAIDQLIDIAKRRLLSLEQHIERRYFKAAFTNATQLRKAIRRAIRVGIERGRQVTPKSTRKSKGATGDPADSSSESVWSCDGLDESPTRSPSFGALDNGTGRCTKGSHDATNNLQAWRMQVHQAFSVDELRLCLRHLDEAIEWDKSIMKVLCAICRLDNNEAELLLCDGCDKGYHTYCFKPTMHTVPQGEFYCWNCVAYATCRSRCFVCGSRKNDETNRLLNCTVCKHSAHAGCVRNATSSADWLCLTCTANATILPQSTNGGQQLASPAPPKRRCEPDDTQQPSSAKRRRSSVKPTRSSSSTDDEVLNDTAKTNGSARNSAKKRPASKKKRTDQDKNAQTQSTADKNAQTQSNADKNVQAQSNADKNVQAQSNADKNAQAHSNADKNAQAHSNADKRAPSAADGTSKKRKRNSNSRERSRSKPDCSADGESVATSRCDSEQHDTAKRDRKESEKDDAERNDMRNDTESNKSQERSVSAQKQSLNDGDQSICSTMLEELKKHEKSWPFHKRVNTKQFPMYRRIIKQPMDIATVSSKLRKNDYSSHVEFAADIRLMFNNCEIFNEDDSDIGRAGHALRQFFEARWTQLCETVTTSKGAFVRNGGQLDGSDS